MTKKAKKESIFQPETEEQPTAGVGHNSGEVSGTRLKSFIERVERLAEEQKAAAEDIRDVYQEAKASGFDPKIMRLLVSKRKKKLETRREEEELLQLYATAIQFDLGL